MQGIGGCDWRGLGRCCCTRFHRDQTLGHAIRGGRPALLADPACGIPGPERSARSMALVNGRLLVLGLAPAAHGANRTGIEANDAQQFEIGAQILDAGLIPILEPEVIIAAPDKADPRSKVQVRR